MPAPPSSTSRSRYRPRLPSPTTTIQASLDRFFSSSNNVGQISSTEITVIFDYRGHPTTASIPPSPPPPPLLLANPCSSPSTLATTPPGSSPPPVINNSTSPCLFGQIHYTELFCHAHDISHRDVKAENLLLDRDGLTSSPSTDSTRSTSTTVISSLVITMQLGPPSPNGSSCHCLQPLSLPLLSHRLHLHWIYNSFGSRSTASPSSASSSTSPTPVTTHSSITSASKLTWSPISTCAGIAAIDTMEKLKIRSVGLSIVTNSAFGNNSASLVSSAFGKYPVFLSGCSAGGLATFLHCDDLAQLIPPTASIKCMSDAGFFLDVRDISGNNTISPFFRSVVLLQGVQVNLHATCVSSQDTPYQCFFPQYALPYIRTPYFILNSAYDVYQFHHIFVPPSADLRGHWNRCKLNPAACTTDEIDILQGFRYKLLLALKSFEGSANGGMFINSCFAHCQSELQETWFAPNSPRVNNKTIAKAVGDWYFERNVTMEVDCPYPCDHTCQNLIPPDQARLRPTY